MDNREHSDDLVDLGAASVETQGDGFDPVDIGGLQRKAGISDD